MARRERWNCANLSSRCDKEREPDVDQGLALPRMNGPHSTQGVHTDAGMFVSVKRARLHAHDQRVQRTRDLRRPTILVTSAEASSVRELASRMSEPLAFNKPRMADQKPKRRSAALSLRRRALGALAQHEVATYRDLVLGACRPRCPSAGRHQAWRDGSHRQDPRGTRSRPMKEWVRQGTHGQGPVLPPRPSESQPARQRERRALEVDAAALELPPGMPAHCCRIKLRRLVIRDKGEKPTSKASPSASGRIWAASPAATR